MLFPFFVFYVFSSGSWQEILYFATAGLIRPALVFTVAAACLTVIYVRMFGGLRLRDLGLTSNLTRALLFTALLWALTQPALAIWQIGTTGQISWNSAWKEPGATFVLGELTSQLFGNALYEEIAFRGFVFVQLFLLLKERNVRHALLKALLISQGFFALTHIPFQLLSWGSTWAELPFWLLATGIAGVIFAVIYIKTQNLFIAVGFHAVFNEPTQLFAPPIEPSQIPTTIVTFLGLALVLLPHIRRLWQKEVFFTSRENTRI